MEKSALNTTNFGWNHLETENSNGINIYLLFSIQTFAAVSAHFVNAQTEYRPEFKDYTNGDGQTLVNIDNSRQHQYHTADFDRSK